jgi:GntR family transcriptional regulator
MTARTFLDGGDMSVSRASSHPLHVQIRRAIQAEIDSGRLAPGEQLPTEHDYARLFNVSLAPVRQALLDLASTGLISRTKGRGTFVSERPLEEEFDLLRSFTDNLKARGVGFRMSVLELARSVAPPYVAGQLGIRGNDAIHLRRLAIIRDEPSALLDSYLPARRFPKLLSVDGLGDGVSLWTTLETEFGLRIGTSRSTIEIARLSDEEAELLQVAPGTPALELGAVTSDEDAHVVEVSRVLYRADKFRFTMLSQRGAGERSRPNG